MNSGLFFSEFLSDFGGFFEVILDFLAPRAAQEEQMNSGLFLVNSG